MASSKGRPPRRPDGAPDADDSSAKSSAVKSSNASAGTNSGRESPRETSKRPSTSSSGGRANNPRNEAKPVGNPKCKGCGDSGKTVFGVQCQCPAGTQGVSSGESPIGVEAATKLSPPTIGPLGFMHIESLPQAPEAAATAAPKRTSAPIHHEIQSDDERTGNTTGSARVRDTSAQSASLQYRFKQRLKGGKQIR